jgi:hypothetical protein
MKILIHQETGLPLLIGAEVTTHRGERGILIDARPPHKTDSSGRVTVRIDGYEHDWYPAVIGAAFCDLTDLAAQDAILRSTITAIERVLASGRELIEKLRELSRKEAE